MLPFLAFFAHYYTLHFIYKNGYCEPTVAQIIIASMIVGAILGAINVFLGIKRTEWNFRRESKIFLITYIVVQITSHVFFRLYYRNSWDETTWGVVLKSYLPFTLHVFCMIPGIIIYHLVGYWGYQKTKREMTKFEE